MRVVISKAPLEAEDEAEDEEEAGAEEILDVRHHFCFVNLGISETTSSGLQLYFYKGTMMTRLIKILRHCSSSQNCWNCKKNLS